MRIVTGGAGFIGSALIAALNKRGINDILFVDELHRFNRAQQDVLLADVENGTVILIGTTTENPFFAINSPLLSRSTIFRFEPLGEGEIVALLRRALADKERGLGRYEVRATDEALEHLAKVSDGDARRPLTALEIGVMSQVRRGKRGHLLPEGAKEIVLRRGHGSYVPADGAHGRRSALGAEADGGRPRLGPLLRLVSREDAEPLLGGRRAASEDDEKNRPSHVCSPLTNQ